MVGDGEERVSSFGQSCHEVLLPLSWVERRSLQNWDHALVGHVGNLPSCFFYSHLGNVLGYKWYMCSPGIHLFLLLTLCLTLQTSLSDFTVCFGRGYDLHMGRR